MFSNAIFLSIRPQYAEKILAGGKTVELRRVRPKHIAEGALVLIYVSSPVKSLVGAFSVESVIEEPLHKLWKEVGSRAGVSRDEFDTYFEGLARGVGIVLDKPWRFQEPLGLQDLRKMMDFRPPQSFRYVTASELALPQFARLIAGTDSIVQESLLRRTNS